MSDLREIKRVVYRHEWTSVAEWVRTLDALADLSDDEISELVQPVACTTAAGLRR